MKWIREYFLIFIFLCGIFSTSFASPGKQQVFQSADSLLAAGSFQDAAIEYERIIFFAQEKETILHAQFQKAQCYKQMLKFDRAAECLSRINLFRADDRILWDVKNELAFCLYLNGEPQKALMQITQLKYRLKTDSLKQKTLLLEVFCNNELKNWDTAKDAALNYISQNIQNQSEMMAAQDQINFYYSKKQLPRLKSPDKAENLSRFVPGLGQIYCGRIAEGSFSFLFNLSFLALGVHQIYHKFYFTGYTAGFGILHKTYYGNLARVKHLANETNLTRHNKFNTTIINYLLGLKQEQLSTKTSHSITLND